MTIKQALKLILTGRVTFKNVWHYWVGNYRYTLFFSTEPINKLPELWWLRKKHWLMRHHIYTQIQHRITWMEQGCLSDGACRICGCDTPALQMAKKSCDKPCYPPLMSKKLWYFFLEGKPVPEDKKRNIVWCLNKMTRKPERSTYDPKTQTYNTVEFYVSEN